MGALDALSVRCLVARSRVCSVAEDSPKASANQLGTSGAGRTYNTSPSEFSFKEKSNPKMRYRSLNTPEHFCKDLAAYADLVGEDYLPALERLGDGLNHKGYVTEIDDLRYSLELELFNFELNRRRVNGRFSFVPRSDRFRCRCGPDHPSSIERMR
jgi:hypothetical protein